MQKDIAEKMLESYNDVFADIVNGILFHGENVVNENDLVDAEPGSEYKIENNLHEQRRDVAKFWKNGKIQICLPGFENQTKVDEDMPLRIISYDGANYRSQLRRKKKYPVVTMVLYFGEPRWKHKNLHSCLEIPEKLVDYVSDYKINVFEIAWLEPEQVSLFKSDFKIVADFFVQKRINKSYNPSKDTIRHVDEVLKTMAVLTGDSRYEHAQQSFHKDDKKENPNMCEVLEKWHNDGLQKGIQQGIKQGLMQGISTGRHESAVEIAKRFLKMNINTDQQIALATELSMEEIQNLKEELQLS